MVALGFFFPVSHKEVAVHLFALKCLYLNSTDGKL